MHLAYYGADFLELSGGVGKPTSVVVVVVALHAQRQRCKPYGTARNVSLCVARKRVHARLHTVTSGNHYT